ncbi:MAG: helix-turn-helix transcriptional regulator [Nocardioides sp.]|uniref:hypothetical protein n=1 Tax=Nocardioides sp. TaxID=35761 RepID=UPI0039E3E762
MGIRHVMDARGVKQQPVADVIGCNQSYVSERTGGKRPCDTDIISAIAVVAKVSPRTIVTEALRAMPREDRIRISGQE